MCERVIALVVGGVMLLVLLSMWGCGPAVPDRGVTSEGKVFRQLDDLFTVLSRHLDLETWDPYDGIDGVVGLEGRGLFVLRETGEPIRLNPDAAMWVALDDLEVRNDEIAVMVSYGHFEGVERHLGLRFDGAKVVRIGRDVPLWVEEGMRVER